MTSVTLRVATPTGHHNLDETFHVRHSRSVELYKADFPKDSRRVGASCCVMGASVRVVLVSSRDVKQGNLYRYAVGTSPV